MVRIVVVDDALYWRKFLSFVLRADASFEIVGESSDGLKAVQLVAETQPTMVLVDIGLPGLDGLESARRMRRVAPQAKILFVTQENDPEIVFAALELGASGYVLKSDAGLELDTAIHSIVAGSTFLSRGVSRQDPSNQ